MLKFEPSFKYDKQTKSTICELTDGREFFCGKAFCHPEDMDMGNEKIGSEIAFRRAYIKLLKRDKLDVKVALAALNQLYYSMKHSKKFNPTSYENKMLQRQIRIHQNDLVTLQEMITTEEQNLKTLINEKDKFYKRIRRNRAKGNFK